MLCITKIMWQARTFTIACYIYNCHCFYHGARIAQTVQKLGRQSGIWFPEGTRDFFFSSHKWPDWLWGIPSLIFNGYQGLRAWTTHLHLQQRLRMSRTRLPLPLYKCMAMTMTTLLFYHLLYEDTLLHNNPETQTLSNWL